MRKGFTIIELLVVITVIGILVTFAVVGYSAFQKRAYDASVRSDLESTSGELEGYRARGDSSNPQQRFPANGTDLATLEIQAAKDSYDSTIPYNMIYCVATTGTNPYQAYKLIARSKSGNIFVMTQDGFISNTLTSGDLTASLCTNQSMTLGSNGMTTGPVWATWVRNG